VWQSDVADGFWAQLSKFPHEKGPTYDMKGPMSRWIPRRAHERFPPYACVADWDWAEPDGPAD
jgi:hypothetical protein